MDDYWFGLIIGFIIGFVCGVYAFGMVRDIRKWWRSRKKGGGA